MKQITKKVNYSEDYDKFSFWKLNRSLDKGSTYDAIVESLKKNNWLKDNPIVVDEKMVIKDGQHRFEACKELGIGVWYVVDENYNLDRLISENGNRKNWTFNDFVRLGAKLGYIGAQRLIDDAHAFGVSLSILNLVANGQNNKLEALKSTDFYSESKALRARQIMSEVAIITEPFVKSMRFLKAYMRVRSIEGFKYADFKKQYLVYGGMLKRQNSQMDYIIALIDLYNYNRRNGYKRLSYQVN